MRAGFLRESTALNFQFPISILHPTIPPVLAFSTCWNNSRHTDGEKMIEEIVDLGFSNIELSHGMTIAKLPGIHPDLRHKTVTFGADPAKVHLFAEGRSLLYR